VHLWGRALHLRRLLGTGVGRRLARRAGLADHVDRVPTDPVDVEVLAATAVLVRRRAFEAVGGFDERYFLYGEDLDLCRRLRRAGFRLVALPVPWARHDSGGTSASWWAREVQWWRGTLGFAARWWSTGAWSLAMGAALVRWVALAATRPRSAPAAWRSVIAEPCRVRRREGPAAPPASRA